MIDTRPVKRIYGKGPYPVKKENSSGSGKKGISANAFAFPLLIVVIFLHVVLVALIAGVNHSSNRLSELMQNCDAYQTEATGMQSRSTIMSETCRNYIQMPLTEDGSPSVGPLLSYVEEIDTDRRGAKVVQRFKGYDVSPEIISYVENASELIERMTEVQLHAVALMSSVYPLPDMPELAPLFEYKLTEEELAMPAQEREALAQRMILDKDYAQLRYYIAENTDNCNNALQQQFSRESEETAKFVEGARIVLWGAVGVIIIILTVVFILFYNMMVKPLRDYSKDIAANQSIKHSGGGIREMQQLADAFNCLRESRSKLEAILRTAAENDPLTGLPNRYCLKRDMLDQKNAADPMAVVMFDVNYLKQTNDSKGHFAGDELICTSAACINECFGENSGGRCYRIGGDEFVAVMTGCSEEDIKRCVEKFGLALKRKNITVSYGYAYTAKADKNSFEDLMAKADKLMYEQKNRTHEKNNAANN